MTELQFIIAVATFFILLAFFMIGEMLAVRWNVWHKFIGRSERWNSDGTGVFVWWFLFLPVRKGKFHHSTTFWG